MTKRNILNIKNLANSLTLLGFKEIMYATNSKGLDWEKIWNCAKENDSEFCSFFKTHMEVVQVYNG